MEGCWLCRAVCSLYGLGGFPVKLVLPGVLGLPLEEAGVGLQLGSPMVVKRGVSGKSFVLNRSFRTIRLGCVWLLLFLCVHHVHCQEIVTHGSKLRIKRVADPQDFFDVVKSRSASVIYILKDMNIRNYFGWVLPSSSADVIKLNTTLEISADPQLKRRPIIDLDGNPIERMISGIQRFNSKRLHYTNMRFPDYFGPGSVRPHMTLDDCIVDLKVETQEGGLAGFWKNLSPSVEQLNEGKWDMIYDSDCEEKFGVSCKTGAILVTNSSVTIKGGQNEQEQFIWQVYNTLFKLSEISTERASDSKIFLMAVSMQNNVIYFPHDFKMEKIVCDKSPFQGDTTIQDPGRSYPPSLVVDFRRIDKCMQIVGNHTLRVSDLILRNLVYFDWWPDVFPFSTGNQSTIVLENVIIELDIDQSFSPVRLDDMVTKLRVEKRAPGLGDGIQKLSRWYNEDCLKYQQRSQKCRQMGRCSPEAKCPLGGIFVEDASFTLNDEHGIERAGMKYHVLHSLFTMVTYIPQTSTPPIRAISNVPKASNGVDDNLNALMVITGVVVVIFVLLCCALGFIWHKRQLMMAKETSGGKEFNNPETVSEGNGVSSKEDKSLKDLPMLLSNSTPQGRMETREDREYQIAANKLLGSVSLGQLIGMGSFGRVYKGTWNGATCAVKVISHTRSGSAEVFAYREAGISTDLHHPNVVQTFIQTTRTFDGSVSTVSEASASQGWLESTTLKSANSSADSEDAKERGYVEIGRITQKPKKARGSNGSQNLSQRDSGNEENWDCMSAVSMAMETWLVQEWCDMGSLDRAVGKGVFILDDIHMDMLSMVDTCIDICRGMMYLKNRNIIHGDLKTSNVLLTGCLHEPKGFTAKVADFGLSRQLAMDASHIHTRTTGTVTHMPPELFNEERLTNASDVYSFGILMWELMAGEAPLLGVPHFVVMKKILLDNWRPTFPDESPKSYQALAEQCWDCAASSRPSFEEVMKMLIEMRVEFTGSDTGRSR